MKREPPNTVYRFVNYKLRKESQSMFRAYCLRALAVAPVILIGLTGAAVDAEQTAPAAPAQQADSKNAPITANGSAQNAQPASGAPLQISPTGQDLTPAQQRYGLPKNPIVGGPVDTDLSKPLSLQRAIRIGLLRQNSVAIAKTQADASHDRLIEARSSYFPQVTPTFQFQTNLAPGGIFVNGQRIGGSTSSQNQTDVLAVRQLLFDSGRREATVGAARRNVFGAEYGVGNSRQDVVLGVTQGYFNLLRTRELVRVEQESVKRAQTTLDAIKAQVQAGTAAQSDTLQAEADLANANVALLSAQNDAQVQEATLKNNMGVVTSLPLNLSDAQIGPPNTAPDPISLERYIKTAYANRLDIKQQQERIYAQGYSVRIAQINSGLSVDASITEGYQLDPTSGEERNFVVSASYPLFDAGNTRAIVRENKAQLELEKRTLDQLQQNVRLNVDQSYSTREQAKQLLIAANVAVNAGQQNYQVALEKQRTGLINILEVINAEVQLINAQVQQVQAVYNYYIADAALQRDIGLNDTIYLPRVPGARPPISP